MGMKTTEFADLAPVLKRLLKEKGLNYRALAGRLGISESSVKKVFIAEDCSLSRLNLVGEALGVKLADVLQAVEKREPEKFRFTERQEKFLVKNRGALGVYWKIVYEELSPEKAAKELGLSAAALFKQLKALDEQGLIELLPGNKVRHPDMEMILWESDGPLMELVAKEWAPLLLREIGAHLPRPGYGLSLRYFTLLPQSARELKDACQALYAEFGRRSVRETRLHREKVETVYLVSAFSPAGFVEKL